MKIASTLRAALVAIAALAGLSTAARADGGTVVLTIYKAGWIIVLTRRARCWSCRATRPA
jgi:hypothetical protein